MTMIERALPLQTSLNVDDEEGKSFRVLNQDNLPLKIVGENVFKPFGSGNQKKKPNGIVYPTRRLDLSDQLMNQQQKQFTRSNGHLNIPQDHNIIGYKKLSSSQGNLNQATKNKFQDDFTKNLDAKLRKLQNDKRKHDNNHHKKPFVTTVTKGKFLEAPERINKVTFNDEQGSKIREKTPKKELYAYASQPMVLSRSPPQNVHRSRCEAAATAAGLPFIYHVEDESNKNHRKKREANFTQGSSPERKVHKEDKKHVQNSQSANQKSILPKWNPYFAYARLLSQEDIQSKESRAEMAKRRAIARKKAKLQSSKNEEKGIYSKMKDSQVQTDPYLEATLVKPPQIDVDSQTDSKEVEKIDSKDTLDSATQLDPGDLFEFDEEIQPVLDILVGKTIESALIEILEEEELASLKEQQRRFLEARAEEQREAEELFEKHLIDRMNRNSTMPSMMLENYLSRLIPPVVEELESEGILSGKYYSKNGSVLPWLVEEVTLELGDILSSGDVLKGIVEDILNRKKEIETALNMEEEDDVTEKVEGYEKERVTDEEVLKC